MPEPDDDSSDVVPRPVRDLMILGWLLLFGGRWLLVPVLQFVGALSPQQLAFLDETILLKCYLALMAVTIVVVVLRAVRSAQSGSRPSDFHDGTVAPDSSLLSQSASVTARGDNSCD